MHAMLRQFCIQDWQGNSHTSRAKVALARVPNELWSGVMIGERGLLFRESSDKLVVAAVKLVKLGSSPGQDGLLAETYHAFPGVFAPWLHRIMNVLLASGGGGGEGLPDAWTTSLLKCIPKFAGGGHRNICPHWRPKTCVCSACLLQMEDALQPLIRGQPIGAFALSVDA